MPARSRKSKLEETTVLVEEPTNTPEDSVTSTDSTQLTTTTVDSGHAVEDTDLQSLTETIEPSADVEDLDVEEIDEPDSDSETEEVDGSDGSDEKPEGKHTQASNKPKKGELPEGWVTPIQLAKVIGEQGLHTDRNGEVVRDVKPQMVYSYMKNSPKDDRLEPTDIEDSNGVKRSALKLTDAIAWWIRKNERAGQRKANAAEKAKKAESKGKTTQQGLVETGEADPSTLEATAEEAE